MHLAQIINKCMFSLNYNPESSDWTDNIVRVINERYLHISGLHHWMFFTKRATLDLHPGVEGSSSRTVAANANTFLVDFSSGTLPTDLAGQTLVIDGTDYTINTRESATQLSLTTQFSGSTTSDWQIEYRRYPYPYDALEVLDIVSRSDDKGKLIYMDWRTEASAYLDKDQAGQADIYIEDEHINVLTPERAISATAGTAGGSLVSGSIYQYCYTIFKRGIESAPGVITEFTATSTGKADLSNFDNLQVDSMDTNFVKRVYRRNKTANSRWKRITALASGTTTYTDTGATIDLEDNIYLYEPGPRAHFRVWCTSDEAKTVEVRYLASPPKLIADSDVPLWPQAYHDLLVNAALKDLCAAHGMPSASQLYAAREADMLADMEDRYLTRSDRQYIRRGFDRSRLRKERWGDPVKS